MTTDKLKLMKACPVESFHDCLRKQQQSPFSIVHPGDAEYSEYMAAWLIASKTKVVDQVLMYGVEVNLGRLRWTIYRRYSEFRDLRQIMIKQMAKRTTCSICTSTLRGMEAMEFPPKKPFYSNSVDLTKRQTMLQQFVATLVGLVQMLRQHQLLMMSGKHCTAHCDVTDPLRCIEEFFDLNYTRYTHFLAERGVLRHEDVIRMA